MVDAKVVAERLQSQYVIVEVVARGPRRTTKLPYDQLGISAEQQNDLEQLATNPAYRLTHEKYLEQFDHHTGKARTAVKLRGVFARGMHLVPLSQVDAVLADIQVEREKWQGWLDSADLDQMQAAVRSQFTRYGALLERQYSPELRDKVLGYVAPNIPSPEQLRECNFSAAKRPLTLTVSDSDIRAIVGETLAEDAASLVNDIPRLVGARLVLMVKNLAEMTEPELRKYAVGRSVERIRETADFAVGHNVVIGDPLINQAAEVLLTVADRPTEIGPSIRQALQELWANLDMQQRLMDPKTFIADELGSTSLAAPAAKKKVAAIAEIAQATLEFG
ncbi:MAG: ubiquitin family protein [Candidatus Dormibacteria bacterium]